VKSTLHLFSTHWILGEVRNRRAVMALYISINSISNAFMKMTAEASR
jgi:hypothetical protein